jgi:hypothetical protein
MESLNRVVPAGGISRMVGGIAVLVLGAVALYYLYNYLYANSGLNAASIITTPIPGNTQTTPPLYTIPAMYEGGDYSVSCWIYVTGFRDQLGTNKHILEIRGTNYASLLVGLGSFTNKLIVRAHTGTANSATAGSKVSDLSTANVSKMFKETQLTSGLMDDALPLCDLPEIELQRWICVGIVLNNRTIDVYLDGKLARSCVLPSFFKVDPKGVSLKLLDFGGFEGFLSDVSCYNYALNPDQVYRIYMTGPSDLNGQGLFGWVKGLFDIKGQISVRVPSVALSSSRANLTF